MCPPQSEQQFVAGFLPPNRFQITNTAHTRRFTKSTWVMTCVPRSPIPSPTMRCERVIPLHQRMELLSRGSTDWWSLFCPIAFWQYHSSPGIQLYLPQPAICSASPAAGTCSYAGMTFWSASTKRDICFGETILCKVNKKRIRLERNNGEKTWLRMFWEEDLTLVMVRWYLQAMTGRLHHNHKILEKISKY
jgi:hypothetical protein